jgi:eukaryotic-like serine/threonine-protein kinase
MTTPEGGHPPNCDDDPPTGDDLLSEADAYLARLAEKVFPALSREALAERDQPLPRGTLLGNYRIVRELARGGMGVVYLAERADGEFERKVAIKVLRRGLDTDDIIERFMRERQILASLAHPAIAGLVDGGATQDGRPYLVMELDEGERIDRYCDDSRLTIRERLNLFLSVAEVVEYAHRHLIVHRDLKPSNITVSPQGKVRLLDFGIAKVLAPDSPPTDVTSAASALLTPAFASPEQLRGEAVTTASDVYQLGLLLYLLLCGELPPDRDGATGKGMGERDPPPPSGQIGSGPEAEERAQARGVGPSHLRRQLRGDVDAIVLKALRPDPSARYASVADLAADVRQHLGGRPVAARSGSKAYRTRKIVARHRTVIAIGMAGMLTVGMYVAGIARARNEARLEAARAHQVTELMVDILSGADPDVAMGERLTVRDALDRGIHRIQESLRDQPATEAELLSAAGRVYVKLGLFQEAEPLLARAVALRGPEDVASIEDLRRLGLARVRTDRDAGIASLREAVARAERLLEATNPTLAGLLVDLSYQLSLEERRPLMERALRILRGSEQDVRALLSQALTVQAYGTDPRSAAEALHREALALRRDLHGGDHVTVAASMADLALVLEHVDAVATDSLHERSIEMLTRLLGPDHTLTLQVMGNHAAVLRDRGEYASAEPLSREVVTRLLDAYPQEHLRNAHQILGLGRILAEMGVHEEADPLLGEVVDLYAQELGEGNPRLHDARSALGRSLALQGRFHEAEQLLLEVYARQTELGDERARLVTAERIVALYEDWGRGADAARFRVSALGAEGAGI